MNMVQTSDIFNNSYCVFLSLAIYGSLFTHVICGDAECSGSSSYVSDVTCTGSSLTYYCKSPYTCCDNTNGCCFDGSLASTTYAYTKAEIAGLTMTASALFVVGFMTLVICGATFCNTKDDNSPLFSKK